MWQVLLVCALAVASVVADPCTDAGGYDLSTFQDNTHKWEWKSGNFVVISLCGTINQSCGISGGCTAPNCCAFCQLWNSDGQIDGACLGKKYDSFTSIPGGIKMKYVDGDPVAPGGPGPAGPREAFIDISCGAHPWEQEDFKEANSVGADGAYAYNITVRTNVICGGGIGGGGYFLIILFCVILPVYLIGGVAYNKFKEGKEGVEVIPNYEFWVASPGYFLAGCNFTKNKVLGLCGRGGYDSVS